MQNKLHVRVLCIYDIHTVSLNPTARLFHMYAKKITVVPNNMMPDLPVEHMVAGGECLRDEVDIRIILDYYSVRSAKDFMCLDPNIIDINRMGRVMSKPVCYVAFLVDRMKHFQMCHAQPNEIENIICHSMYNADEKQLMMRFAHVHGLKTSEDLKFFDLYNIVSRSATYTRLLMHLKQIQVDTL